MKFFIDHCVPDSVGRALKEAGHEVVLLRERLAPDSPDPLVAAAAEMQGAILVSIDSDFKTLAPRANLGRRRFQRLSRIAITCGEPQAAARIKQAMSLIELEWLIAEQSRDPRMIVEIGKTTIRTLR